MVLWSRFVAAEGGLEVIRGSVDFERAFLLAPGWPKDYGVVRCAETEVYSRHLAADYLPETTNRSLSYRPQTLFSVFLTHLGVNLSRSRYVSKGFVWVGTRLRRPASAQAGA